MRVSLQTDVYGYSTGAAMEMARKVDKKALTVVAQSETNVREEKEEACRYC